MAKQKAAEQHFTAADLQVLTLREWAKLNNISWKTAKRLFAAGEGPPKIQLSARRVGVRIIDNARWQEARLQKVSA